MMSSLSKGRSASLLVGLVALLVGAGCAPTLSLSGPTIPPEIEAVLAARDRITISENDPAFTAEPGRVIDDLSGLDGCWASHTAYAPPEDIPSAFAVTLQNYTFFKFDMAAGRLLYLVYGELSGLPAASLVRYEGPFTIDGNRLTLNVSEFTMYDPASQRTLVYPEDFRDEVEQSAATSDMSEQDLAAVLASLDEPLVFEYLVTLDGDRVTLVPRYEYDDGTVEYEDARVCFRFDCPE